MDIVEGRWVLVLGFLFCFHLSGCVGEATESEPSETWSPSRPLVAYIELRSTADAVAGAFKRYNDTYPPPFEIDTTNKSLMFAVPDFFWLVDNNTTVVIVRDLRESPILMRDETRRFLGLWGESVQVKIAELEFYVAAHGNSASFFFGPYGAVNPIVLWNVMDPAAPSTFTFTINHTVQEIAHESTGGLAEVNVAYGTEVRIEYYGRLMAIPHDPLRFYLEHPDELHQLEARQERMQRYDSLRA